MNKQSNAPPPDELLLTAREALKAVLREPDTHHTYTVLMVMNAMGIAARAMRAGEPVPIRNDMSEQVFCDRVRGAGHPEIIDAELMRNLRRYVEDKLSVSNPRFQAETAQDSQ